MNQNPYIFTLFPINFEPNICYLFYVPLKNHNNIDLSQQTKCEPSNVQFGLNETKHQECSFNSQGFKDYSEKNVLKAVQNEKNIKEKIDQQYNPNIKATSKSRKQQQNQMRNVIPNIMHQVISFIQKPTKSKDLIQKLILRNKNQNFTIKRFFLYQKLLKEKINYYVNAKTLEMLITPMEIDQDIFPKQEVQFYCQISRIIIKLFLRNQSNILILTSSKIKTSNKILHLKANRILLQMLHQ